MTALSTEARTLLARRLQAHVNTAHSEQLVVFYEVREGTSVVASELRRLLLDRLPRFMVPARFVALDTLPLLPNGKIDRRALSAMEDRATARSASTSPVAARGAEPLDDEAARLLAVWRHVLGPSVGVQDDFFEAGGDSIAAMRLISRAAAAGFTVSLTDFFRAPTLLGMLAAARSHVVTSTASRLPTENRCTPVLLTPIQHWFFEQEFAGGDWWNQARMFEIPRDLDHARLEAALHALIAHHESFRLAFVRKAGGWQQHVQPIATPRPIARIEVIAGDEPSRKAAIEQEANALQAAMRLDSGLLLRALRFSFSGESNGNDLLYVIGHHLCVDLVSWDILAEDLETAVGQLESAQPVKLASTTPFSDWSAALYAYAQAAEVRRERSWWSTDARADVPPLPRDLLDGGPNDEASAEVVSSRLEREDTERLLDHAPVAARGSLSDYVLSGLVYSLAAWSGSSSFRIGIEGHGRAGLTSGIDPSRTIGWFTTYWPVVFGLTKNARLPEALRRVREQLSAVPGSGMGYGVLRYLTVDDDLTRELSSAPPPEVVFNYVGRQQVPPGGNRRFRPSTGVFASRDPRARRASPLEVSAMIVDGRLELACVYSRNIHHRETIQTLMRNVRESLIALTVGGDRTTSASDFPDAGLSEDELNSLIDPT